ncbi:MAG: sensor histidine kinase [Bacteroidetes bacterium]|jgi:signal transduction histidine kinase|nr:sensor histidine kinase [Bacteroidota bacterium]
MSDKLFYTVVITSILIAIVIVFFVVSVIRYHKQYILLQKERIQAQIMMQEQERKRIANDLHDSLGPMLSTVKLFMNSISVNNETDRESLGKASGYIDEAIHNLREISYNLLPSSLDRNNLEMVVNEYISRMDDRLPVKINFTVTKDTVIPKKTEIHLFRIIQEIIHNTMKHSEASNLWLSITSRPDGLYLVSEDNGRGFDAEHTRAVSGGLGLKSIENRCQMLDADFKLITAKNGGCKMIIVAPIDV